MRKVYGATSRAARLNSSKGFTLIELLIVIAIIAILASLAIPQYIKYQKKARVSSYAEPLARGCMLDIAAYCVEFPNQTPVATSLVNCNFTSTTVGSETVVLSPTVGGACSSEGLPNANASVTATLSGVTDYTAVCNYQNQSVKCTIKG